MKDNLIKKASASAKEAVGHYLGAEYERFFVQGAVAFELLGKARLAMFHPALVIDGKHVERSPWDLGSTPKSCSED
jgi:hypothetical protein